MKATLLLLVALALAIPLKAQESPAGAPDSEYAPVQLDQLVAPIALYPDPLLAVILPASTVPSDIALAAQYAEANGDPAGIDAQAWDQSVKALAHYPDVLKWMNDNADWTSALGAAFAMQPSDVMRSVQQLRARARAAGTLVSNPQQQVETEGDDILIEPTQQQEVFVPQYDPDQVYDGPDSGSGAMITFGVGMPVGPWLGFECDWDDFGIWQGPWQPGWAYRRDWRNPAWGGNRWHPDARRGHELVRDHFRPGANPPLPRTVGGGRLAERPAEKGRAVVPPADRGRSEEHPVRVAPVRNVAPQSRPDYRGWNATAAPKHASPAPSGPLFGGYDRGTQTREESNRGNSSRQAPVKSPGKSSGKATGGNTGGRAAAPAPSGGRDKH